MKKIVCLLFTLFILINFHSFSQSRSKMNFGAALAAHNPSMQENKIDILVQGNVPEILKSVEEMGGTFRYSAGNIVSIELKIKNISLLAEKSFVKRIEAKNPFSKIKPMNDSMLVNNRVVAVHNGATPLTQAYKGDGVVLGFIDTGIDFLHPDFRDSLGKTRVKYLWDQSLPDSVPPQPYNYGQEWNASDIDNGKATAHIPTAQSQYGHGTHVASVACGNGLATNHYGGVAPNADIIFVALNFNDTVHNVITDAANYIYAKAALLGKPCVINASVGDYYGSHDGLNLEAQTIKSLITAQNNRSFVAAAGNAGGSPYHLGYSVTSDTNFTWFSGSAYIAMYADTNNFKNVHFTIGADDSTSSGNYSFRGNIPFSTIASHVGILKNDTLFNGPNRIGVIQSYGDLVGGVYSMEYNIIPDSAYNWRLSTTGSGKFDEWSFDVVEAALSDSTVFPALKKYKQPDLNKTIVSSFQCLDEVIAVGNYINRNQFINYDTLLYKDTTLIPGALYFTSSHGPTRDGRIKPDIAAPGEMTMACLVTADRNTFITWAPQAIDIGAYHISNGGTSNACPGVAGTAALYLQKNPGASWMDVKNSIIYCARQDTFTGTNLPDNLWGYGKADAFASLTSCFTSVNNNQHTDSEEFIIYPNPNNGKFTIQANSHQPSAISQINIYNVYGEKIYSSQISNLKTQISLNLPNGIYFCSLREGEKIIATKKIIISE